jgi:hypothetical protein
MFDNIPKECLIVSEKLVPDNKYSKKIEDSLVFNLEVEILTELDRKLSDNRAYYVKRLPNLIARNNLPSVVDRLDVYSSDYLLKVSVFYALLKPSDIHNGSEVWIDFTGITRGCGGLFRCQIHDSEYTRHLMLCGTFNNYTLWKWHSL